MLIAVFKEVNQNNVMAGLSLRIITLRATYHCRNGRGKGKVIPVHTVKV